MKNARTRRSCIDFLKRNGFENIESNSYANDCCNIVFEGDTMIFADNQGNETFFDATNIYTLIGWLTYYSYIGKNYK